MKKIIAVLVISLFLVNFAYADDGGFEIRDLIRDILSVINPTGQVTNAQGSQTCTPASDSILLFNGFEGELTGISGLEPGNVFFSKDNSTKVVGSNSLKARFVKGSNYEDLRFDNLPTNNKRYLEFWIMSDSNNPTLYFPQFHVGNYYKNNYVSESVTPQKGIWYHAYIDLQTVGIKPLTFFDFYYTETVNWYGDGNESVFYIDDIRLTDILSTCASAQAPQPSINPTISITQPSSNLRLSDLISVGTAKVLKLPVRFENLGTDTYYTVNFINGQESRSRTSNVYPSSKPEQLEFVIPSPYTGTKTIQAKLYKYSDNTVVATSNLATVNIEDAPAPTISSIAGITTISDVSINRGLLTIVGNNYQIPIHVQGSLQGDANKNMRATVVVYSSATDYIGTSYSADAPDADSDETLNVLVPKSVLDNGYEISATVSLVGLNNALLSSTTYDGIRFAAGTQAYTLRVESRGLAATTGDKGVWINNNKVFTPGRSYGLIVISNNGTVEFSQTYDLYGNDQDAVNLANKLNSLSNGKKIVVTTFDEPQGNRLSGNLPAALRRCGASADVFESGNFKWRSAYLLIGTCGSNTIGIEKYAGSADSSADAWTKAEATCTNGVCVETSSTTQTCSDTDGNNLNISGSVAITSSAGTSATFDACVSGKIREYTCSGNQLASNDYDCPTGKICSNGACVAPTTTTCIANDFEFTTACQTACGQSATTQTATKKSSSNCQGGTAPTRQCAATAACSNNDISEFREATFLTTDNAAVTASVDGVGTAISAVGGSGIGGFFSSSMTGKAIVIQDGTQANNRILVSDSIGGGSWKSLSEINSGTFVQGPSGTNTEYAKIGNLLIQWGRVNNVCGETTVSVQFPTRFNLPPLNVQCTSKSNSAGIDRSCSTFGETQTSVTLLSNWPGAGSSSNSNACVSLDWLAIGPAP